MYYYLISGLPDLLADNLSGGSIPSLDDFVSFCEESMSPKDFALLKKTFIFNDIKNVANIGKDTAFITPSFYSKEDFDENVKDTDCFFPFISDYLSDTAAEKRLYPQMTEEDELIMRFYADLDSFVGNNKFLADYYRFELVLRNVLTIFNMRKAGLDPTNFVIRTEDFGENVAKSNNPDLGLGGEYPFIIKIAEVVQGGSLVALEETLDKIRFDYIDNLIGCETFSVNVVMAYSLKLLCAARWAKLSPEKGRSIFDKIVAQIRENIKFSDEFSVVGGKR